MPRLSVGVRRIPDDSRNRPPTHARWRHEILGTRMSLTLRSARSESSQPAGGYQRHVRSIAERTRRGYRRNWAARGYAIVEGGVYPALDRQVAAIKALRPTTAPADGAQRLSQWRCPLCRRACRRDHDQTVARRSASTRAAAGADISGKLDTLLNRQATRAARSRTARGAQCLPAQLYPETDAGRAQLIADLNTTTSDEREDVARLRYPATRAARHSPRAARN